MLLKRQLGGTYLYPVHRLDRPTSGVLVFGKTREAAQGFGILARERRVSKVYIAMVRGHADPSGELLILGMIADWIFCETVEAPQELLTMIWMGRHAVHLTKRKRNVQFLYP